MTFDEASKLVTKLQVAPEKQREQAVLYLNIWDYVELRAMCPRCFFDGDRFCGVELKVKIECPQGQHYIVRR